MNMNLWKNSIFKYVTIYIIEWEEFFNEKYLKYLFLTIKSYKFNQHKIYFYLI